MTVKTQHVTITIKAVLKVADGSNTKRLAEEVVTSALLNRANLHREDEGLLTFISRVSVEEDISALTRPL